MSNLCSKKDLEDYNLKETPYTQMDLQQIQNDRLGNYLDYVKRAMNFNKEADMNLVLYEHHFDPKLGKFSVYQDAFMPYVKLSNQSLAQSLLAIAKFNRRFVSDNKDQSLLKYNARYQLPEVNIDMVSLYADVVYKLQKEKRHDPFKVAEHLFLRNQSFQTLFQQALENFIQHFEISFGNQKNSLQEDMKGNTCNKLAKITVTFGLDPQKRKIEELMLEYVKQDPMGFDIFLSDVEYSTMANEEEKKKLTIQEKKQIRQDDEKNLDFHYKFEQEKNMAESDYLKQVRWPEEKDSLLGTIKFLFTLRQ